MTPTPIPAKLPRRWDKIALVLLGLTLGDAINHLLLAYSHSPFSTHGIRIGVAGNWTMVAVNTLVVGILWRMHCRLEIRRNRMLAAATPATNSGTN